MPAMRPHAQRMTGLLVGATTVTAGLFSSGVAQAVSGPEATAGQYAYVAKLTIGDEANSRGCSGTLIDSYWLATAASCFAATPGEQVPAGKPALKTVVTLSDGKTAEVTELAPRTDRDLVLARLATPATGIAGVKRATAAPAAGTDLTAAGFGRTKTEWVPGKLHTGTFTTNTTDATTLAVTGKGTDVLCKGDTGGPLLNAAGQLVGINSKSWQGGCLGTPTTETRTGAVSVRTDDLGGWIDQVRSLAAGWKTETLVQSGTTLYQGIRLVGGDWTGFSDVQATTAGSIGGIRSAASAGINGDTHVLAISTSGGLFHTVRKADGTWTRFGDVFAVANSLGKLTQVSAVSVGSDLHVIAVADGKVFHTVRNGAGQWTTFGDVSAVAGPTGTVTAAATASVGGQLQVAIVSGGKAFHTIRNTAGQWGTWGSVTQAAGPTGPVTGIAMAGIGGDAHVVVSTDNGTRQYHAVRKASASWDGFGELTGYLGNVTVKSLSAAHVDGEFQLVATTADNKVLHTVRHTDRTWSTTGAIPLQGIPAAPGAVSIAGTL
ncbi:trypsin-like serine protease [Streptomyces sp. NPDC091268]|uniref:trypsin-like serine protease n=1 Tax=Streptomyces sp. NPDC091268 TaxID=3365979 RepID=UPI0037F919E1